MTKEDIIRMAREAGLYTHKDVQPEILAFANLVAAAEREACLDAMMQSTTKAVDTAMALEREACAKLIEEYPYWLGKIAKQEISAAILARGNT